jgi:hypothetical protein
MNTILRERFLAISRRGARAVPKILAPPRHTDFLRVARRYFLRVAAR